MRRDFGLLRPLLCFLHRQFERSGGGTELGSEDAAEGGDAGGIDSAAVHKKFLGEDVLALGQRRDEIEGGSILHGTIGVEPTFPNVTGERTHRLQAGGTRTLQTDKV